MLLLHLLRAPQPQPRGEALQPGVLKGTAAQHRSPQRVVEGAQTTPREAFLHRRGAPQAVLHLAEVPALAVEQQLLATGQLVEGPAAALHAAQRQVAHEVEAEAVHQVQ